MGDSHGHTTGLERNSQPQLQGAQLASAQRPGVSAFVLSHSPEPALSSPPHQWPGLSPRRQILNDNHPSPSRGPESLP